MYIKNICMAPPVAYGRGLGQATTWFLVHRSRIEAES